MARTARVAKNSWDRVLVLLTIALLGGLSQCSNPEQPVKIESSQTQHLERDNP